MLLRLEVPISCDLRMNPWGGKRYGGDTAAYIRDQTTSNRKAEVIKTINKAFLACAFFGLLILSTVACCGQSSTSDPPDEMGW